MKTLTVFSILAIALATGAIKAAESRYQTRKLMGEIQTIKSQKDAMRLEWSQLLLEESTLTDEAIIYQVAQKRLRMGLPKAHAVVYRGQ